MRQQLWILRIWESASKLKLVFYRPKTCTIAWLETLNGLSMTYNLRCGCLESWMDFFFYTDVIASLTLNSFFQLRAVASYSVTLIMAIFSVWRKKWRENVQKKSRCHYQLLHWSLEFSHRYQIRQTSLQQAYKWDDKMCLCIWMFKSEQFQTAGECTCPSVLDRPCYRSEILHFL